MRNLRSQSTRPRAGETSLGRRPGSSERRPRRGDRQLIMWKLGSSLSRCRTARSALANRGPRYPDDPGLAGAPVDRTVVRAALAQNRFKEFYWN
jgi:hypothetical protein